MINGRILCGFHFDELKIERSAGSDATDTKGLEIGNRKKLCELKSIYIIDDNGKIIFPLSIIQLSF